MSLLSSKSAVQAIAEYLLYADATVSYPYESAEFHDGYMHALDNLLNCPMFQDILKENRNEIRS